METKFKKLDSVFTPFEFTITFETEAEANEFWHRLNCSESNIKQTSAPSRFEHIDDEDNGNAELFNNFNKIYRPKIKGIKK